MFIFYSQGNLKNEFHHWVDNMVIAYLRDTDIPLYMPLKPHFSSMIFMGIFSKMNFMGNLYKRIFTRKVI
jgi:hypothetical protein